MPTFTAGRTLNHRHMYCFNRCHGWWHHLFVHMISVRFSDDNMKLKNDVANQFYWPNTVIRHKAYLHFGKLWTQFFCVNSRFHATTCRGLAFKTLRIYYCAEMKFPGRLHSSKVSKFCRQCIFQHLVKVLDPANLYHWWALIYGAV